MPAPLPESVAQAFAEDSGEEEFRRQLDEACAVALDGDAEGGNQQGGRDALRRSARVRFAKEEEMANAAESREFQPDEVDELRCQALVWNHGQGRLQCSRRPLPGKDLCRGHNSVLPCGRVRGPIPAKKLVAFRSAALKLRRIDSVMCRRVRS